jgi:hypothetical protein
MSLVRCAMTVVGVGSNFVSKQLKHRQLNSGKELTAGKVRVARTRADGGQSTSQSIHELEQRRDNATTKQRQLFQESIGECDVECVTVEFIKYGLGF